MTDESLNSEKEKYDILWDTVRQSISAAEEKDFQEGLDLLGFTFEQYINGISEMFNEEGTVIDPLKVKRSKVVDRIEEISRSGEIDESKILIWERFSEANITILSVLLFLGRKHLDKDFFQKHLSVITDNIKELSAFMPPSQMDDYIKPNDILAKIEYFKSEIPVKNGQEQTINDDNPSMSILPSYVTDDLFPLLISHKCIESGNYSFSELKNENRPLSIKWKRSIPEALYLIFRLCNQKWGYKNLRNDRITTLIFNLSDSPNADKIISSAYLRLKQKHDSNYWKEYVSKKMEHMESILSSLK